VTEDSSRAAWLQEARSYLGQADPVLARLIDDRPSFDPRAWMTQLPAMDLYGALLFQIAGQQLSVAATRRILGRIQALFGGHLPSPAELLEIDPARIREAGLSWRKIGTLRELAARLSDGRLDAEVLSSLPDDELMTELTAIPGIGPWTVQGALLIALQREDVVLPGDLALRKAVQAAYQLDHLPSQQEVLAIAEKWRPYRSLATSYLFSAAFEPAEPAGQPAGPGGLARERPDGEAGALGFLEPVMARGPMPLCLQPRPAKRLVNGLVIVPASTWPGPSRGHPSCRARPAAVSSREPH
jgi:DNA-3-methyladenine glycosylase II